MNPALWRNHVKIHPAAELLPRMNEDQLRELAKDIARHGLREAVARGSPGFPDG